LSSYQRQTENLVVNLIRAVTRKEEPSKKLHREGLGTYELIITKPSAYFLTVCLQISSGSKVLDTILNICTVANIVTFLTHKKCKGKKR
jgi:hypothetical protein